MKIRKESDFSVDLQNTGGVSHRVLEVFRMWSLIEYFEGSARRFSVLLSKWLEGYDRTTKKYLEVTIPQFKVKECIERQVDAEDNWKRYGVYKVRFSHSEIRYFTHFHQVFPQGWGHFILNPNIISSPIKLGLTKHPHTHPSLIVGGV